jgi:hypothetical protein
LCCPFALFLWRTIVFVTVGVAKKQQCGKTSTLFWAALLKREFVAKKKTIKFNVLAI